MGGGGELLAASVLLLVARKSSADLRRRNISASMKEAAVGGEVRLGLRSFGSSSSITSMVRWHADKPSIKEFNHLSTTMTVFSSLQNFMLLYVSGAFQIYAPKEKS